MNARMDIAGQSPRGRWGTSSAAIASNRLTPAFTIPPFAPAGCNAPYGLDEPGKFPLARAAHLAPGHLGATLGLGDLRIRRNRPPDAEPLFRSALAISPDSFQAVGGIAAMRIGPGGDHLGRARGALNNPIEKNPSGARARFRIGQAFERQDHAWRAMTERRNTTELAPDR